MILFIKRKPSILLIAWRDCAMQLIIIVGKPKHFDFYNVNSIVPAEHSWHGNLELNFFAHNSV